MVKSFSNNGFVVHPLLPPTENKLSHRYFLKCDRIKNEDLEQTNTIQQKAIAIFFSKSFTSVAELSEFQYKATDLCH